VKIVAVTRAKTICIKNINYHIGTFKTKFEVSKCVLRLTLKIILTILTVELLEFVFGLVGSKNTFRLFYFYIKLFLTRTRVRI
jgi:hypothetical protein